MHNYQHRHITDHHLGKDKVQFINNTCSITNHFCYNVRIQNPSYTTVSQSKDIAMNHSVKLMLISQLKKTYIKPVAAMAFCCVALVSLASTDKDSNLTTQACVCDNTTDYNSSLPSSHPSNRCATQNKDVNWGNWLTGNSRSSQFHFLDLLELLHGFKNEPVSDIPNSNNTNKMKT